MAVDNLTTKQELFIEFYLETNNASKSAELAGYNGTPESLRVIGCENLAKPHIKAILDKKRNDIRSQFEKEANNAFNVIVSIINNERVSARTRLDACKDVLDRAGYKPSDKLEVTGQGGSPIQYETRLTKEIASRAKRVLAEENTMTDEAKELTLVETTLIEGTYVIENDGK